MRPLRTITFEMCCSAVGIAEASGDRLEELRALRDLVSECREALYEAAADARAGGKSWEQIGDALGMTRQGAAKQLSPRPRSR